MEIKLIEKLLKIATLFKIDLIVWKSNEDLSEYQVEKSFKIDLIVWKFDEKTRFQTNNDWV